MIRKLNYETNYFQAFNTFYFKTQTTYSHMTLKVLVINEIIKRILMKLLRGIGGTFLGAGVGLS